MVAAAAQVVKPQDIFAIIGYQAERVREALAPTGINFVLQTEQRGTGHAIMAARDTVAELRHCSRAVGRCSPDPAGNHHTRCATSILPNALP